MSERIGCDIITVSTDTQFSHLAWQRSEKELAEGDKTLVNPGAKMVGKVHEALNT